MTFHTILHEKRPDNLSEILADDTWGVPIPPPKTHHETYGPASDQNQTETLVCDFAGPAELSSWKLAEYFFEYIRYVFEILHDLVGYTALSA
jgi:hypothetical protein